MAIVCSDLHCNLEKVRQFLAYKPEEEHVFAGDILDSFTYSFFKATNSLRTLIESDCILLWGNHDIGYRKDKPFSCSGFHWQDAPAFQALIEDNIRRFQIAYGVDNYLITHAGLADAILKDIHIDSKPQTVVDYLNTEPIRVFWIGQARGGFNKVGGPLWFDFRSEKGLSKKYNQVFGHCCLKEPWEDMGKYKNKKYHHVCINTYEGSPELYIFDTSIREIVRIDNDANSSTN